jgi:hypothetical protein
MTQLLGFWTWSIIQYSENQRTQHFGNWIYFHPQVSRERPTVLCPLERANPNHWTTHVRVRVTVTLRLTVYRQSVHLGDKPLETHNQNFYFPTEHLWL